MTFVVIESGIAGASSTCMMKYNYNTTMAYRKLMVTYQVLNNFQQWFLESRGKLKFFNRSFIKAEHLSSVQICFCNRVYNYHT